MKLARVVLLIAAVSAMLTVAMASNRKLITTRARAGKLLMSQVVLGHCAKSTNLSSQYTYIQYGLPMHVP